MSMFEGTKLPQHEPKPTERRARLVSFQEKFRFDQSVIRNVPISASIPDEAKAGPGWGLKIIATAYKLRRNWEKMIDENGYVFERELEHKSPIELAGMLAKSDLLGILGYCNPDLGVALEHKRPKKFTDYYQIFKHIERPEGSEKLLDDADFADSFVAGLNPVMLQVMKEIPGKLALDQAFFGAHPAFAGEQLETALQEGRLFFVDYEALDTLEAGVHPDQKKYTCAPIAVLGLPQGKSDLEIIGIQVGQNRAEYPMLSPRSRSWDWLVAKTLVKTADINFHEVSSHLGLTHLVIDPIVVATWRQLSDAHPLHKLLLPHFEGTLPINALAVRRLINEDGAVEQLLFPKLESDYRIIEQIRSTFHFRQRFLKADMQRRGVGTDSRLKHYPYRDDALLVWDAIESWVNDYVNNAYAHDQDVIDDSELASWVDEISDPSGGCIRGFAPESGITTRSILTETLTMIIFTASAQHAAMNFAQLRAMAVPYQPMASYAPAPKTEGLTEADAVEFLPPLDRAIKQTHIMQLLGGTYYTQLGQYTVGTFLDPRLALPLVKFQLKLREIDGEIDQRNRQRRTAYPYLKPTNIPQSINI